MTALPHPVLRRAAHCLFALSCLALFPPLAAAQPTPSPLPRPHADPPVAEVTLRAQAWTVEAERLIAAGRADEALVQLQRALSMDPTYVPAYLALADLRVARGDLREANRVLSMAIEHNPSAAEAYERRAQVRGWGRDLGGAALDLEDALHRRPSDLALHERTTQAWIATGQMPRALASARRWVAQATAARDQEATRRARQLARACLWIVDSADPVAFPEGRGSLRALLASLALAPVGMPRPGAHR